MSFNLAFPMETLMFYLNSTFFWAILRVFFIVFFQSVTSIKSDSEALTHAVLSLKQWGI